MNFDRLPDLVIWAIFKRVCGDQIYSKRDSQCNTNKWAEGLVLLSVSRTWRNMALPLVHRQSFISCIANDSPSKRFGPQTVVKTSLDTIPNDRHGVCQPKYLLLHIEYATRPILILKALLVQIRQRSTLLNSVQHLDISIKLSGGNPWNEYPGTLYDIKQATSLGSEFARLVSGITNFEWPFVVNDGVILAFIRDAASHYASSLSRISCEIAALTEVESFSDSLQQLDIRCYSGDYNYFPPVHSAQLTMLRLVGIEKEFTWCSFQGDKGTSLLDFSRLRHLSLGVPFITDEETNDNDPSAIWYGPADIFEYSIFAPRLAKLRTQLCPFALSFLSSITGVDVLPQLDIRTMVGVTFKITNLKLTNTIKRKFSAYANNSVDDMVHMDWIDFANDIFSIPDFAEHACIEVGTIGSYLDSRKFDWPYLNCLVVDESIDISNILTLIKLLPHLEELEATNIKLNVTDNDQLTIPGIYNAPNIELQPLDASIKKITVKSDTVFLPTTLQTTVSEYLCKVLPSLESIEY